MRDKCHLSRWTIVLVVVLSTVVSCAKPNKQSEHEDDLKKLVDMVYHQGPISKDSLLLLIDSFEKEGKEWGLPLLYREMGKKARNASHFNEAIEWHRKSLEKAKEQADTLAMIQALNNIGTDYRRSGIYTESGHFHSEALLLAQNYSQKDDELAKKNLTMAYNGLGNVALAINFLDTADLYFRRALAIDISLGNVKGEALNYGNIGTAFERKLELDSARYYYDLSMEKNREANNRLGIALTYIHWGELAVMEERYKEARADFTKAIEMIDKDTDKWHWLEAVSSLINLEVGYGDYSNISPLIEEALKTAYEINSLKHLSDLYYLRHIYNSYVNKYEESADDFKKSTLYRDSVVSYRKIQEIIESRFAYESHKLQMEKENFNRLHRAERQRSRLFAILVTSLLVLILAIALFLYKVSKEREKHNKLLQELSSFRSDFFTKVTHEFRTPLTLILGYTRRLQNHPDLPKAVSNRYINTIEQQGEVLLGLIDQILDLSRFKSTADSLQWRKGNVVLFTQMIVESFTVLCKQKEQTLTFFPSVEKLEVVFAPDALSKVLYNLLSNAIKFTDRGKEILVLLKKEDDNNFIIQVADKGEGISEDVSNEIFDLYFQEDPESSRSKGFGIGLSLVYQLVQAMGGEIKFKSIKNTGTVFSVILPIREGKVSGIEEWKPLRKQTQPYDPDPISFLYDEKPNADETSEIDADVINEGEGFKEVSILVVEDNKSISSYLRDILQDEEYNVYIANDGLEGYNMAMERVPDLIITDLMMPQMSGEELCEKVKSNEALSHIPIIMLTAKTTDSEKLAGLRLGADLYITKPFNEEILKQQVHNLIYYRHLLTQKFIHQAWGKLQFKAEETSKVDVNDREKEDFLESVTEIMSRELKNSDFTIQDLADELAMTTTTLNRKIKGITGYSSISYFLLLRIKHAQKLLLTTDKQISEISETCGIVDPNYFSRVFKKYIGMTPSQYQKKKKHLPEFL